jgi:outer membrane protein assembly factor BamB
MSKKFLFLAAAWLAVVLLSGCSSSAVRGSTWPGLAVSNDVAYLADGAQVFAVNLKDGKELWHYPEKANAKLLFYSTPYIASDGLVIVGSAGNTYSLVAVDPNKMDPSAKTPVPAEVWKFEGAKNHWVAAPLEVDNLLYAPNADGNLYVLNLNGQLQKTIQLDGHLWAQPVTDGKSIYITSLNHSVFAIDKQNNGIIWHKDLGGAIPNAPTLAADGSLYVGSFDATLEKFDPATGNHEAVGKTSAWVWGTPLLLDNNLYFGDLSGNFYSYNVSDGKYNWNPIQPDGPITGSPIAVNDNVLVATESGSIYQVTKDGQSKIWSQPGGKIYTTPVLSGDLVLVAPLGAENYLYAYDFNGHQAWAFKP